MNTPTPRTDAAYAKWQEGWDRTPFGPDFARTLERELAALTAERDQLRADLDAIEEWKKQHGDPAKDMAQLRAEAQQAHVTRDATCIKLAGELREARFEVKRLTADGAASAFIDMACRASRAEADRNNLRADLHAIIAILAEEKAIAERAEREVERLRHLEAVLRSSAADMIAGSITAGGAA